MAPPPDPATFLDPLAAIEAEHKRQRQICDQLDALTEAMALGPPLVEKAGDLLTFLTRDLDVHTEDEERDLFPLLLARSQSEDQIDRILKQLSREHAFDKDLVDFIVADLELLAQGIAIANPTRLVVNVREFSETQRRHLTWENVVLLPLARRRLRPADMVRLGKAMAARRGLTYPEGSATRQ